MFHSGRATPHPPPPAPGDAPGLRRLRAVWAGPGPVTRPQPLAGVQQRLVSVLTRASPTGGELGVFAPAHRPPTVVLGRLSAAVLQSRGPQGASPGPPPFCQQDPSRPSPPPGHTGTRPSAQGKPRLPRKTSGPPHLKRTGRNTGFLFLLFSMHESSFGLTKIPNPFHEAFISQGQPVSWEGVSHSLKTPGVPEAGRPHTHPGSLSGPGRLSWARSGLAPRVHASQAPGTASERGE